MTTFIYALMDPTGRVGYIGKCKDPHKRLIGHKSDARRAGDTSAKRAWINSLAPFQGPIVGVLEAIGDAEWPERERFWIAEGRRRGWPLTNVRDGGQAGRPGPLGPQTAQHRQRIADANRGKSRSAGAANPKAKLTAEQVAEIRSHPRQYGVGVRLAAQYGVTAKTIRLIRSGELWRKPA